MTQPNALHQPQTPPVEHYDYRPMQAEHLQSDQWHYDRMVQLTDAIVEGEPQAAMAAVVADKANYVALADVCNDSSRNTAAPGNLYPTTFYILDTPTPRENKQTPAGYKNLFNYDTYVKEGMKAAAERKIKPETYNRDPAVATQITETIHDITFYADYLAGNPRYIEFADKFERAEALFAASVPAHTPPEEYSKLYNDWLRSDPNHQKWLEGAKRFQQEEERIITPIRRLAEIVDGNRDYGVLAQKKLNGIFGEEATVVDAHAKAGVAYGKSEERFDEASGRSSLTAHERSLKQHDAHQITSQLEQANKAVGTAEKQLAEARQQNADEATIQHLESQLADAQRKATAAKDTAQSKLPGLEADIKNLQYEGLRLGPLQGRERAGADVAKGAIRKTDIAVERATTVTGILRRYLNNGELRVSYEITPAERAEYTQHKQQLESMVREAIQAQRTNNTIEQEHALFTARIDLQSYIALIKERLQDADPNKYDPRYPEYLGQYTDMVNLEGQLLYNTAAQRLARAQNPQNPGFKGRAEVVPMPDEGLLVKDGTNVIFYPDGSRAYLQDDNTVTSRTFSGRYQVAPVPQPRQPETTTPTPTRVERNAGFLGRLAGRGRR